MPARSPYYVAITNDTGVIVQGVADKLDPLASSIGYTKLAETGELPQGKTLAGTGKADALQAGCVAVNLVYKKGTKLQTAKVLISPTVFGKGIFTSLVSKKYGTNDIAAVRVPRRRIYVF
jgi:hypothetical protein